MKTFEQAVKLYEKKVSDPSIVECDIMMEIEFGGYYRSLGPIFTPPFIWLDGEKMEHFWNPIILMNPNLAKELQWRESTRIPSSPRRQG